MNLRLAMQKANELIALHLPSMGWRFEYNNRRRAAGVCNYRKRTIELSKPLTELSDDIDVIDTILHEIAHALTPGHQHDWVWVKKAREIGCNGKRCFGGPEQTKESTTIAYTLIAKYKGVCPNGHENFLNRMPKRTHSCPKCSSRFDTRFIITYGPNI